MSGTRTMAHRPRVDAAAMTGLAGRGRALAPPTRARMGPLRMAPPGDRTEAQANRFASTGRWADSVTAGGADFVSGYSVRAVERAVTGPGSPLDSHIRRRYEAELGVDLAPVRVHTDATASASARALGARAYTLGSHIVFSPGRYQPATGAGRELLAHELAHVTQQAASGVPMLAAQRDIGVLPRVSASATATAEIGFGFWDVAEALAPAPAAAVKALDVSGLDLLKAGARYVLGDTLFSLLQAFLLGFEDGLEAAPQRQQDRIVAKFEDFDLGDASRFAGGYVVGVLKGLGGAVVDFGKALVTLLKLPVLLNEFLMRLPERMQRYASRIARFIAEGEKLLKRVRDAFARDPVGSQAQVERFLGAAREAVLAGVRKRGQKAATEMLEFLEESWSAIGERFGKIAGHILFEVLLAVGTELIGNLIKAAGLLAGRIAASVIEAVRALGRLIPQALEWLGGLARRFTGEAGELIAAIRAWLKGLLEVVDEMAPGLEAAAVGGARAPTKVPIKPVAESRIVERRPGSTTVEALYGRGPKPVPDQPPKRRQGAPKPKAAVRSPTKVLSQLEKDYEHVFAQRDDLLKRFEEIEAMAADPARAKDASRLAEKLEQDVKRAEDVAKGFAEAGRGRRDVEGTHTTSKTTRQRTSRHSPERVLEANLEKAGLPRPDEFHEPHHIVPKRAMGGSKVDDIPSAERARDILKNEGIDINDAANGIWLPRTSQGVTVGAYSRHATIHTKAYYDELARRLERAAQLDDVPGELARIRKLIEEGEFPH